MTAAYRDVLQELAGDRRALPRRQQVEWLAQYSRACNAVASDEKRRACVIQYQSAHTQDLRSRVR